MDENAPVTEITLRPAELNDVPGMSQTAAEGFGGYAAFAPPGWRPPPEPSAEEMIAERMALARAVAIVAEVGGEAAGHVLLIAASESREPVADPELAHVMHVFVRAPFWGTGVARELHRAMVAAAHANGFLRARLFTPAEQARARRFYEREGWLLARGPWHDHGLQLDVVEYRRHLR